MVEGLIRKWKGYVEIELLGYSPERFLNLCTARGIELWKVQCSSAGGYRCCISLRDFWRLKPILKKSGVRLRLSSRRGLPFFLHKNRRRKWYAAGIGAFFLFLYIMSLFIWDIQIEGNRSYTRDTLLEFLEAASVRAGIRIKEKEVLAQVPQKDDSPANIVAARDGIITSMVVRQGTARTVQGEEVKEGQLLIEGRVPIVGDDGAELRAYLVPADGDVRARTVHTYEKEIPLFYEERTATGRERRGIYLKAGPWSLTVLLPAAGHGEWDYFMEEKQLTLFTDFCLPVYLGNIRGREMVSYEKNYGERELRELARALNGQAVKNLEEKGVHILENNDRIETCPGGWRISGRLVTEESIARREAVAEKGLME